MTLKNEGNDTSFQSSKGPSLKVIFFAVSIQVFQNTVPEFMKPFIDIIYIKHVLHNGQIFPGHACSRSIERSENLGGGSSTVVGIKCPLPLVEIWLTDLPKSGRAVTSPAHKGLSVLSIQDVLLLATLWYTNILRIKIHLGI